LELLSVIFATVVGGIANRFRGGGVFSLPGETPTNTRSQVRRIIYLVALGDIVMMNGGTLWQAVMSALVVFLMLLTGWGRPIGAVGGWEDKPLEEFKPLDWLASTITKAIAGKPEEHKQIWGFVWLSYYGILTGFLLSLTTGNILSILTFGAMGAVYWSVFQFYKWRGRAAFEGWETAEIVFGAISFLGLTI
jgi:hypothetical protein